VHIVGYGREGGLQTFVYIGLFFVEPFCERFRGVTLDAQGFADGEDLEEEWKVLVMV